MSRISLFVASLTTAAILVTTNPRRAEAQPALDAMLMMGIDQDVTAIGRLFAGGMYGLGKFAVDAHIGVEGFLRVDGSKGVRATTLPMFDLGVRYGFQSSRFVGPFVAAGGSFGLFFAKPNKRRVKDDPETCASVPAGPTDECEFAIDKNASFRLGFGWGFAPSDKTTVAVRLDLTYWLFSVSPFNALTHSDGEPIPREIPRPQDSLSVMIGLEFMRWN